MARIKGVLYWLLGLSASQPHAYAYAIWKSLDMEKGIFVKKSNDSPHVYTRIMILEGRIHLFIGSGELKWK